LIRLHCDGPGGKAPEHPQPDQRLFDVPLAMVNQIARSHRHRQQGWDVIEEPI